MRTKSKKIKSNRPTQTATKIIKTIIHNTSEHLNDTDKKLLKNNSILEGLLKDFDFSNAVKSFAIIIKNNNDIISANALFRAVEVVETRSSNVNDDGN